MMKRKRNDRISYLFTTEVKGIILIPQLKGSNREDPALHRFPKTENAYGIHVPGPESFVYPENYDYSSREVKTQLVEPRVTYFGDIGPNNDKLQRPHDLTPLTPLGHRDPRIWLMHSNVVNQL